MTKNKTLFVCIFSCIVLGIFLIQNHLLTSKDDVHISTSIVGSTEHESSWHMPIKEVRQGVVLLQSLTSQNLSMPKHNGEILFLEQLYEDAPANYNQILEKRKEKIHELNRYMEQHDLSKQAQKNIRGSRASSDATFAQDLKNVLTPLDLNPEVTQHISKLAKQIQQHTQDLATVHRFQTIYASVEDTFCVRNDDTKANPYVRGTFTYTKNQTEKIDMCVNSNQDVRQYICQAGQEADMSPTITPCTYGCLHGACIPGIIIDARIIKDASRNKQENIPTQTDFWIQLETSSDEEWAPSLSYEVASAAFEHGTCTLESKQDTLQTGVEKIHLIGPISCSQWGTSEIRVRLRHEHGISDFRDLQIEILD